MDPFWLQDPYILIDKHRLTEFVPTANMSTDEKLNAVTRFAIYMGALLVIIFNNISYIYITLIAGVLVYLVKEHYTEGFQSQSESEHEHVPLQQPTKDNPFMNVLITDYVKNPNRGPAANIEDPKVKEKVEKNFNNGLFRDINNIWDRNNSQRQFVTNPSTTIPNDRDSFMKWCYNTPFTCKDGNLTRCLKYEDVRVGGQVH